MNQTTVVAIVLGVLILIAAVQAYQFSEIKAKIRELGGDISESVSKNTSFVVLGLDPGSKADKARKLGIKTISEKEFLRMIK